jgi:alanine racemase
VAADHTRLEGLALDLLVSHLACADEPGHALNAEQLAAFTAARARLPNMPASLANSSGIFLGPDYHFDLGRPGVALYGVNPTPGGPTRIATVAVGYADGYLRSLSNQGSGYIDGIRVSLAGRVSMDLITFDVSAVPGELAQPGAVIDLFGPDGGVDELAGQAGTIGYEILTALGRRYFRTYRCGG